MDRKVSVNWAIALLAKNGIEMDDRSGYYARLSYLISKNRNKPAERKNAEIPKEKSNFGKMS